MYLKNVIRIITETCLRIYKELTPMKKDQVDLTNAVVWIPDSKTPNGMADVPLTDVAVDAFREQMTIAGDEPYLFPSDLASTGHQTTFRRPGQQRCDARACRTSGFMTSAPRMRRD